MFRGYMPGLRGSVVPRMLTPRKAYMGTHGLLRLFSPPSISKTLRFLSKAASRPATTHPAEPPVEVVRSCSNAATDCVDLASSHDNVNLIWDSHNE